jgi:hypothetical protein
LKYGKTGPGSQPPVEENRVHSLTFQTQHRYTRRVNTRIGNP